MSVLKHLEDKYENKSSFCEMTAKKEKKGNLQK